MLGAPSAQECTKMMYNEVTDHLEEGIMAMGRVAATQPAYGQPDAGKQSLDAASMKTL